MVLRGRVSVGAVSRSNVSDAASFGRATKHVMKNLINSSYKKHEIQCWYGGVGLAEVASISGNVITIEQKEFAAGIWCGAENMKLAIYDAAGVLRGNCSVVSVDIVARTITVDSAPAGVVATDVIYEYGAKGKEFMGVHKMLTTQSGSTFGIPHTYSLWKGTVVSAANNALSFAIISDAVALAVAKGLEGKVTLFVNPRTWSDLISEQTALRNFKEGSMIEYSNGAESIKFHSQNGMIEIISSTFVKEGYAYGLQLDCFERVGSSDITFQMPGLKSEDYAKHLENSNAIEFRTYSDAALFCDALGVNFVINNINNG